MKQDIKGHGLYLAVMLFLLAACDVYDIPVNRVPVMTVSEATDITRTSATVHGYAGTAISNVLTFEYREKDGEFVSTAVLTPRRDSVHYTIEDLRPGTSYVFRLCSDNGRVKVRSGEMTFTTLSNVVPTVSPLRQIAKGPTSVIVEYTILDDGGEDILSTGCRLRNTSTNQQVDYPCAMTAVEGDMLRICVTGMDCLASYELTPYAVNSIGEATGSTLSVSTDHTILLGDGGNLQAIMQEDGMHYDSLSFSGRMNGDDFRFLRGMDVRNLNLADVEIIEGGGAYIPSRYTKADTVGYGMFSGVEMETLTLPLATLCVEEQALKDCVLLRSVLMPASAASILPSDGCEALEAIMVPEANVHYRSVDGILYNADVTGIVWMPLGKTGEVVLPATLTSIGDYAFRGCHFSSFVMGCEVKEMGMAAFYGSWVEKVELSDALQTVATASFQQCSRLTEVHLGKDTQLMGEYVFDGSCLKNLYVTAEYPPVCYSRTFATTDGYDLFSNCILHVPQASRQMYRNHRYWGKFMNIVGQ